MPRFASSSNLHSAEYDKSSRTLTVRFNSGSSYSYSGVHPNTYHGLVRAKSKGNYFHRKVKGRFEFEKKARSSASLPERARAVALSAYYGLMPSPFYEASNHYAPSGTTYLGHAAVNAGYAKKWLTGQESEDDLDFERTVNSRVHHPLNRAKTAGFSRGALKGLSAAGLVLGAGSVAASAVQFAKALKSQRHMTTATDELDRIDASMDRPASDYISMKDLHALGRKESFRGRMRATTKSQHSVNSTNPERALAAGFSDIEDHLGHNEVSVRTGNNPNSYISFDQATMRKVDGKESVPYETALHELAHDVHAQKANMLIGDYIKTKQGRPKGAFGLLPHGTWPARVDPLVKHEYDVDAEARTLAVRNGRPFSAEQERINSIARSTYLMSHNMDMHARRSGLLAAAGGVLGLGGVLAAKALSKTAASSGRPRVRTALEKHQRRIRDRMRRQNGLVVAHDMGSGKSLSSIAVLADAQKKKQSTLVSAPASLLTNYTKEITKHTGGAVAPTRLVSQQKLTLEGAPKQHYGLMVVDEAHRARSVGSKLKETLRGVDADKRMLMSGTSVYNHPSDVGPLVNIAAGQHLLPETPADFERRYVTPSKVWPKGLKGLAYRLRGGTPGLSKDLNMNDESLNQTLHDYVDYYKPSTGGPNFPSLTSETHKVQMSDAQRQKYDYMMGRLPPKLLKKVQMDLPPDRTEAKKLVAFLGGPRQIATSVNGLSSHATPLEAANDSPKIQAIMQQIKDHPKERHLIYSNYIGSSVEPLSAALNAEGVRHGLYTGSESKKSRDADVAGFNKGERNVLLVSSAGAEGLDLKGVRHVHVVEPHWNEQKINQVVARARRFKSHAHLPEAERNVQVHRYLTENPEKTFANTLRRSVGRGERMQGTAEGYIQARALEKETLNQQMYTLMSQQTQRVQREMEAKKPVKKAR